MDSTTIIQKFLQNIQDLHEVDTGDFRRRASLYLQRLIEDLKVENTENKKLQKIRDDVLYGYYDDVEEIRQKILDQTKNL